MQFQIMTKTERHSFCRFKWVNEVYQANDQVDLKKLFRSLPSGDQSALLGTDGPVGFSKPKYSHFFEIVYLNVDREIIVARLPMIDLTFA